MADKCCKYGPFEDGSSGKANHYGAFEDGSGGKSQPATWNREDGSGAAKGEQHSPLTLKNHEKGK